jgi:hypothetical protein
MIFSDFEICSDMITNIVQIFNLFEFQICLDLEFVHITNSVQISNLFKILSLFKCRICSNFEFVQIWTDFDFFQIFVLFKYQILFRFENGSYLEKFGLWEVRETVFF